MLPVLGHGSRNQVVNVRSLRLWVWVGLLAATTAAGTDAQTPGHSPGPWNRVTTEHFEFLYPDALESWALHMARRMEAVHGAVEALIGFAPEDRVTVLVDDPGNVSNGSMNPGPLLYVWPTPPSPRSMIGENRGWAEILAVHEFAHAAHLTRPSRNPRVRLVASLFPLPVTNLMRVTPRWATEGYATYVEGRLTGSGRPHGVWRPAVLRTWALEGQLPTYGAMSGADDYYGGSMAYLMGSAFLEWLVAREGGDEETLPNLWRRLTAQEERSFTGAFRGVFGAPPAELYGLFTVDVTERALGVRETIDAAGGGVAGDLFQRYSWTTGDPAISPDGRKLAVRRTSKDDPSRLVVINTVPDTLTTEQRERYEEIFEEDSLDVEPVQRRPRPQRPEATLHPVVGRSYHSPAWMPDGQGILVIRDDVVENGQVRPDLFLWDWEDGGVARITRGQAIREASPSPDGSWAVGVRCLHGSCDIVRIELDNGAVATLARGAIDRPYYHPRVAPDGRTITASVQTDGGWRLVAMDIDGGNRRFLGPDDGAARFDAEYLGDGRLVLASTRGGIHDLELLEPSSGRTRPLTRVVGAAVAPTAAPNDTVFFLSLHSRGWDLRRIPLDTDASPEITTDTAHFPAATVPLEPGETFEAEEPGPARRYGLGPQFRATLPVVHATEDGFGGGVALAWTDPIGRFSWHLQGAYGTNDAPLGGSLRLRYRGFRQWIHLEGFWTRNTLPDFAPPDGSTGPGAAVGSARETYYGGLAGLELHGQGLSGRHVIRLGGSYGRLDDLGADRILGFAEFGLHLEQRPGSWRVSEWVEAHGASGRSHRLEWTRWRVHAGLDVRGKEFGAGLKATVAGSDAPVETMEAIVVGGAAPLLFDPALMSQRLAMPALATGAIRGAEVRTLQADFHVPVPATPFVWYGNALDDARTGTLLVGAQVDETTPPIPFIRFPATHIRFGGAYILNGPNADQWRAWAVLRYAP